MLEVIESKEVEVASATKDGRGNYQKLNKDSVKAQLKTKNKIAQISNLLKGKTDSQIDQWIAEHK